MAGKAYDSVYTPSLAGSSGASSPYGYGGAGGGVIKILANKLTVDGSITANGANGGSSAAGIDLLIITFILHY